MVKSPRFDAKPLARYRLRVGDESVLPGLFGNRRLRCGPDNVDLKRVRNGTCDWFAGHDSEQIIGRVESASLAGNALFATTTVADILSGRRYWAEIQNDAREGVSPGFLIEEFSMEGTPGNDDFFMNIIKWSPYEISSTSIPRPHQARVVGKLSMTRGLNADGRPQDGEPSTTDDPVGLSLQVGRKAFRDGKGDAKQRVYLTTFYAAFDRPTAASSLATRPRTLPSLTPNQRCRSSDGCPAQITGV